MAEHVYTFIGAGKMATAIASGMVKSGIAPETIRAYDVSDSAAAAFRKNTGATVAASMKDALADADVVILAVKPQYAAEALAEAKPFLPGKLMISIAAGLTISYLQTASGIDRVIRVMPNTPALALAGMSCYAGANGISGDDLEIAEKILSSVGIARKVSEGQLDAVTGLSGSGPAFVMEFIMALADGGVYSGLSRDAALELALQTVYGTAKMCQESSMSIGELRDAVISPAGTTAEGIMVLQKGAFKGTASAAVVAAAERSRELGKGK
ncbi:MAG: pyrroline-5-carboxylate reductase [Lentisphaeria bacterium]|nr:pyrroline-5-carboxylate reductase [Lentisphaeria bacterium]